MMNSILRFRSLPILATCLALLASPVLGQGENRSSMTLNDQGEVLRFKATSDDEPTAVIDRDGVEDEVVAFGDTLDGKSVSGMGAIADLNNAGVAVIQIDLNEEDDGNQALITSNGGSPTLIAVARNGGAGTALGGDTLCHIGPMPEIAGTSQVAYFGHVDIDGSGLVGRACEESEARLDNLETFGDPTFGGGSVTAWSPSFLEHNAEPFGPGFGGDSVQLEPDGVTVSAANGPYGYFDSVKSVIVRYTPGPGNEVLLTGQAFGIEADTVTVTDPRWVSSPTEFYVSEVDLIRNADAKISNGGVIAAFATLNAEDPYTFPAAEDSVVCSNVVQTDTQDNPYDDPDGSDPYFQYSADCPEVNSTVDVEDQENTLRESIILVGSGAPNVIAVAGPPDESDYQAFDYDRNGSQGQFVINNAGQLLFKATVGQEDDPNDLRGGSADCGFWQEDCYVTEYRLELYTPGVGIVNIAKTGDLVPTPGSTAAFCDFAPHYGLADDGSFAFHATIAGDGTCEFQSGTNGAIDESPSVDNTRGHQDSNGFFYYSQGTITEIVRTQYAADQDLGPGPFTSTWSGNEIDEIGSVAVVEAPGLVQFFVENEDFEPEVCDEEERGSSSFGGGEWTAMLSWSPGTGIESLMEEGDPTGTNIGDPAIDYIFRIHTVGPKLRAQGNSRNELVAKVEIDTDGDCSTSDEDPEDTDVIVVTQGTPPPNNNVLEIPVGGPLGLGLFAGALLLFSIVWLRSRGSVGV